MARRATATPANANPVTKTVRIGIIGAGQLGQMLGYAARNLGVDCVFLDPSKHPPAAACGTVLRRPFDDPEGLKALAQRCDVVTYEFENVPVDALRHIPESTSVFPPTTALRHAQDRLQEKRLFERLNIPIAQYCEIEAREDIDAAAATLGLPMVIKTRRLGYDGKGQIVASKASDLVRAWNTLGGLALIAEKWIPFDFEVSCIAARAIDGEIAIYPLSHNVHSGGILRTSKSPLAAPTLTNKASAYIRQLLNDLDYVGVLALEFFVIEDELLANEFAPRVHNSGHWTIEGSETSQFENHLRAVLKLPLGSTASRGHAGMVNLIGEIPPAVRALNVGQLHDYGKVARIDRKLGHMTVTAESPEQRDALVEIIDNLCDAVEQHD